MTARARRRWSVAGAGLVAVAAIATVAAQSASGWDLSWRATSGGGGSASGGAFALTGSIGQPVAMRSTGGVYAIDAGFLGGGAEKYRRFFQLLAKDGLPD